MHWSALRRVRRALVCTAIVAGCGGGADEPASEPPVSESVEVSTPEEIRMEIEVLGYEIADLEAYLSAPSDGGPPRSGPDTAAHLSQAARAREAALFHLERGEDAAAADSVTAAAAHVEQVKRGLSLAEEWGEEIPD